MRPNIYIWLPLAWVLFGAAGCSTSNSQIEPPGWKARIDRGRTLVRAYGCHTCHEIPTVVGVRGSIGLRSIMSQQNTIWPESYPTPGKISAVGFKFPTPLIPILSCPT